MLDCQRREVGIGNQIGAGVAGAQHLLKEGPMLFGHLDQPDARLLEPALTRSIASFKVNGLRCRRAFVPMRMKAVSAGQHNATGFEPLNCSSHQ